MQKRREAPARFFQLKAKGFHFDGLFYSIFQKKDLQRLFPTIGGRRPTGFCQYMVKKGCPLLNSPFEGL
jgi:hypothetical protein